MLAITDLGAEFAPTRESTVPAASRTKSGLAPIFPDRPTAPSAPIETLIPSAAAAQKTAEENAPVPWYKNWKVMVPLGLGAVAVVGVGIWALK